MRKKEAVFETTYFRIGVWEKKPKTCVYIVQTDRDTLGFIKWYAQWRQYAFFPETDTWFSKGCLEAINEFLDLVNKKRDYGANNLKGREVRG